MDIPSQMHTAYYAWTDMQLINYLNLCLNQHKNKTSELFVLMLDRISSELLDAIEKSNCFKRIHKIVPFDGAQPWKQNPRKISALMQKIRTGHYYHNTFANAVGSQRFDAAIVPGLWANTSALLDVLHRGNRTLKIDYIEEGNRHGLEVFEYTLGTNKFIRVLRWFYDGRKVRKWKRHSRFGYFYSPERYGDEPNPGYAYVALKPIDKENSDALAILSEIVKDQQLIETYQKKRVILLEDMDFQWTHPDNGTLMGFNDMVAVIRDAVGADSVLVRRHPDGTSASMVKGVMYDESPYPFELLLLAVDQADREALSRVKLISYQSAILLNVVLAFPFPVMPIFLYRMSTIYQQEKAFYLEETLKLAKYEIHFGKGIQTPESLNEVIGLCKV